MTSTEKIELFNKLGKELKEEYGEFESITLVDEYPDGRDWHSYCTEQKPLKLIVKRR